MRSRRNGECVPRVARASHRAVHSVVLNVAEGGAQASEPSKRKHFRIARASLWEVAAALDLLAIESGAGQGGCSAASVWCVSWMRCSAHCSGDAELEQQGGAATARCSSISSYGLFRIAQSMASSSRSSSVMGSMVEA